MSDEESYDEEDYTARVGTRVGEWDLVRLLGVGGMAAVYKGVHTVQHNTAAALKILHSDYAGRVRITKRFLREGHIANAIGHDGAVSVMGEGTTEDGCPYLVMEMLVGETVEEIIAHRGRLPMTQALGVADQVLAVLEAAHAKGIVHRDIKPENIFITNAKKLKLLDFGIARLADYTDMSKTSTGSLMGTPTFMPPEQALGRMDQVGPHTDIWAVGAVIFNLLSGETVHTGETAGEVLVNAATHPARSLATVVPDAPLELVTLLDEALAYDVANRIPDAILMRKRIRDVIRELRAQGGLVSGEPMAPPATVSRRPSWLAGEGVPRTPVDRARAKLSGLEVRDLSERDMELIVKIWEAIDSALTSRLHYGEDHPQAGQRFDAAWKFFERAIKETSAGCLWNVTPYSFFVGETTVWEPRDQLGWITYRAFASGVRMMGLLEGLTRDEFSDFLDLLSLDPRSQMAPEDDLVTLLWERGFPNVIYREVDTFSEGDQADREQFEQQRREVAAFVRAANEGGVEVDFGRAGKRATGIEEVGAAFGDSGAVAAARAQASVVARHTGDGGKVSTDLVQLDEGEMRMLRVQLDRGAATTDDRFVFAASHGYAWASGAGQERDLAHALGMMVEMLAAGDPNQALQLAQSLLGTLRLRDAERTQRRRGELATALITGEVLRAIESQIRAEPKGNEELLALLDRLLAYVLPGAVPAYLEVAASLRAGPVLDRICGFVGRCASGNEEAIGLAVETAHPNLAIALCRMLKDLNTTGAGQALERASKHPDAMVRLEALQARAGEAARPRVRRELEALIADPEGRAVALPTIVANQVREAAPILAGLVHDKGFDKLKRDDRTQIFEALASLAPERAEPIAITLLGERKLVAAGAHEESRAIALGVLGRISRSVHALSVVEGLERARFGVSTMVRDAAEDAGRLIRTRIREVKG